MSTVRTSPYYVGRDLRRHRPALYRAMASLPNDLTVYLVHDGSDERGRRLFRCVIARGDEHLVDVRRVATWEGAWNAARGMREGVVTWG